MKHVILFLAANPRQTDRLALDREARAIQMVLDRARHRESFELITWWATEPLDLLDVLRRHRPSVVHFSGHGSRGELAPATSPVRDVSAAHADREAPNGLVFHGPDGDARSVSTAALCDAFAAAGSSVVLVVLNACYTEPQADALCSRVDCVVGMTRAVHDEASISFAAAFYAALGDREPIASAYRHGCAAIHLDGVRDEDCPRLRVRDHVDADLLILGEPARPRRGRFARVLILAVPIIASVALLYRGRADLPARSDMVAFDAATFRMGSTPAEIELARLDCQAPEGGCRRELFEREGPVRTVTLSAFSIDRTEVTNQMFARWLSSTPAMQDGRLVRLHGAVLMNLDAAEIDAVDSGFAARSGAGYHPAAGVSPEAARAYCAALGKRLPTEAEWEYAARGAMRRRFAWGDEPPPSQLGCAIRIGRVKDASCPDPRPVADVGTTPADVTPEGVHDLGGNVSEWVADRFADTYPTCSPCRDPIVSDGEDQVIRGGNHMTGASVARAAARSRSSAVAAASRTGFRCARSR